MSCLSERMLLLWHRLLSSSFYFLLVSKMTPHRNAARSRQRQNLRLESRTIKLEVESEKEMELISPLLLYRSFPQIGQPIGAPTCVPRLLAETNQAENGWGNKECALCPHKKSTAGPTCRIWPHLRAGLGSAPQSLWRNKCNFVFNQNSYRSVIRIPEHLVHSTLPLQQRPFN